MDIGKPRVVLADDHAIMLEGLCRLLEQDVDVVGTAGDGRELVKKATTLSPDVVIVDISMPNLNGIDAARQLRKKRPQVKILFLTQHADPVFAAEAFRAGAAGFVLKECAAEELLTAVRAVHAGGTYIPPRIAKGVLDDFSHPRGTDEPFAHRLTSRQREVLQLVAEGKTIKEISVVLGVSRKTVEFHKYNIMKELDLHTTAELTKYAVRGGIVRA